MLFVKHRIREATARQDAVFGGVPRKSSEVIRGGRLCARLRK